MVDRRRWFSIPTALLGASLAVLAGACGSSAGDPVLAIGAYQVGVPSGWQNVSSEKHGPGKLALQTVQRDPSVIAIFSPAPEPMPFDPTDSVECDENGGRMPGLVGRPRIVELPAGKACAVQTSSDGALTQMAVFRTGTRGLMAQCIYRKESDASLCDAILKQVRAPR